MKIILFIVQFLQFILSQNDPGNPMNYALPLSLPDQNQDGQSDNHDFQRAFLGLHLTRYEISQLFEVCDVNRDGRVSQAEWSNFYNTFLQPFEQAQIEPRDGLINAQELVSTYQNIDKINSMFAAETDKDYLQKIMETLTSRIKPTTFDGQLSLNLNEFVFFRRSIIAWVQCTQTTQFMSKSSIQTCAQSIMLPNIHFSENQQGQFFQALKIVSRPSEIVSDMYKFLTFLSSFHKYDMFKRIGQNKISSGVITYNELIQACKDSEGPSQKLNIEVVDSVFGRFTQNLEFTGLDFLQFYMLMQNIDFIYIYGQLQVQYLKPIEFETLLDQNAYSKNIVENIDDIQNDLQEIEETPEKPSLWGEQKLLSQHKRRKRNNRRILKFKQINQFSRFFQRQATGIPKNIEARNVTFNIFDANQDGLLNGGELFNFQKFASFFQYMVKGNIHLIYQKNLDMQTNVQMKKFIIPLFKEELADLVSLQRWLRDINKYNEIAINFIQFASNFFYKHHFRLNGQQSQTSDLVPFPSFVRILQYLGMQLHKADIVNAVQYTNQQPNQLYAQKFDLTAYQKDGALVNFQQAWRKSTLRWSQSFMKKKFFDTQKKKKRLHN